MRLQWRNKRSKNHLVLFVLSLVALSCNTLHIQ
jgi:hypothetical protein